MRFFSDKTIKNNKIFLFTALKVTAERFLDVKKLITFVFVLGLLLIGYFAYAQSNRADVFSIQTMYVFPDVIQAPGWANAETLVQQNVDSVSLYQDFNKANSAYPLESDTWVLTEKERVDDEKQVREVTEVQDETAQGNSELGQMSTSSDGMQKSAVSQDEDIGVETESVPKSGDEEDAFVEVVPDVSVTPNPEVDLPDVGTNQDSLQPDNSDEPAASTGENTTVLETIERMFSYAVSNFTETFLTEGNNPPSEELQTTESEELQSDESIGAPASESEVPEVPEALEQEGFVDTSSGVVIGVSTSSEKSIDNQMGQNNTSGTTTSAVVEASTEGGDVSSEESAQKTPEIPNSDLCDGNCTSYKIALSGFGLPAFDGGTQLSGAQLRMSFAAKRKPTHDVLQEVQMRYSFDKGETWGSAGKVSIDDEASNSINGGYYLFALPQFDDPALLDTLIVELVYNQDLNALENLFVESMWLELFTIQKPDLFDTYATELAADDGFEHAPLSGDDLVLVDGTLVTFDNTDENVGETLIIKSDDINYTGLTKTTTYFNVTNISNRDDTFSLKTYFPKDKGSVLSLEEWNRNKPKNVVIPEYRPFVYNCAAGWELTDSPIGESLEDISRLIAPTPEEKDISDSEPLQEVEDTPLDMIPVPGIGTTDDTISPEIKVEDVTDSAISTSSSQTLLSPESEPLFFATDEAGTGESLVEGDLEEVEDEVEPTYSCRETNVVRTCDSLEGDNTSCLVENVKVREHELVRYAGGWEEKKIVENEIEEVRGVLKKIGDFLGFGPDKKDVPDEFEVRAQAEDSYTIKAGETKYFKMEIEFPPLTNGEFWIEAVGNSEYGLLDPYWSSQWQYRIPVTIDNTSGTENLVEQQVFLELTSVGLTDFWSNVNTDGSDVRFVAEIAGSEDDTWYDTSWNRRTAITIQSAQVDTSLTDFPVYIDLATLGTDFFSNTQSSGADIRITASDGVTELAYELVSIDTAGGSGELYFKAPDISDLTDTVFYVYYDNAGALGYTRTDLYGGENVWTNNYLAVYHFEEDQAGTGNVGVYLDATSNNYDGDDENTSNDKTGRLGLGQEFGDSQSDFIRLPSAVLDGGTDITQSWWHRTSQTGQQAIISGATGPGSTGNNEYLTFFTSSTGYNFYNDTLNTSFSIANHADNNWHAFTNTRNDTANEVRFYMDGVPDDENPNPLSMTALSIGTNGLVVGQEQDTLGGGFATTQNFEGSLDELRFSTGIRSDAWIASEYTNQNTPGVFYATSSSEILTTTQYTELDFWLQYFNATTSEADIWVQVDSLPAAASTTIYMYYGNVDAVSASDEFETFTYSTTTDTYYVLDSIATGNIEVYSLIDNNIVQLDGGTQIALNAGETTSLSGYSGSSVISVLGPISATINDATADTVTPVAFATTTLAGPTNRDTSIWYIHSPFASSSVQTYIAGSGVPDESVSIATGTVYTSNTDPGNNQAVIIESSDPVLAYHRQIGNRDSFVLYPPTTEDLFGIDSNATQITTLTSNPNPVVYCSGGASATVTGITRGEEQGVNNCAQGSEGLGNAVRFTGALYPVAAIQQADSDGGETTSFLPQKEFSTEYYMSTDSAYAAVVCSPRFGVSAIEVQTNDGTTIESATCTPSGNLPGKAYFNNGQNGDVLAFTAGHKIVSTNGVPFYVIYEDDVEDNDETNIWGAVQARKFLNTSVTASFGAQEAAIEPEYDQLSYWWYQNTNAQTPTSTWPLGEGVFTTEGDPIVGQGSVNDEETLRLRMNLQANVATGTASTTSFKLQYTASDTCSSGANSWYDVGIIGSTTAAFTGYDNSLVSDGSELSTSTLASSTVLATYEEENLSSRNPNTVNVGEVAEWDWSIQAKNATVNTNYCFRMVYSAGQELATYTSYPQLNTSGPPLQPEALVYFDNERTAVFDSVLEFVATDAAGDEINYQVQIDNDLDFSSPAVDRNSLINFLEFENLNTPSDKAPFNSGARIRFISPTTLVASTTYWWRVRGNDPDGSNTNGDWSVPRSFTTDGSVTVSEWHQTTGDQFSTDAISNLSTSTTAVTLTSSPATLTTTAIDFDDATVGNAWGEVSWNDTETSGTILYQIEYNNSGSWTLIPDSEIANNSIGNGVSPINILGLDTVTYNEIRIVATFTGTTLSLEDLTVTWGQRVETPTLGDPFDNEQTADTTPTFTFTTTDPQSDDLEYEISYGTDYLFVASTTLNSSSTPANFANVTTPVDTNPYISGDTISYTVPGGSALTDNTTYWWRVRAKDPNGADSWSPWSDADSFTVNTATVVSTWLQTTQEQFDQGTFNGLKASTSDSVVVNDIVGEYGKVTTTDNTWVEINTLNTYNNMVVVGSARYTGNPQPERTVRVRNKTANTFEIKVDDYTSAFAGGSTIVDYMIMEAGDWTILDGGTGTRIIAGTAPLVSDVKSRVYSTSGSTAISFSPAFAAPPVMLATVSSDNDTSWVFTHTDDSINRGNEPTNSIAGVSLARSFESAVHDPEDIDYIAMDVASGVNSGIQYDFLRTPDNVDATAIAMNYNNASFTSPPGVVIVNNIGEDGGDGGFAFIETATPGTATQFYPEIGEGGVGANGHTQEIVSAVAFEADSGSLLRDNSTVNLSGTVASEEILFSDGAGPKFERLLFNQTSLGNSTTSIQVQYQTATSSWALIPDSQIPGNSIGTTTSPVNLTDVDVSTYDTLRLYGTLSCDGSNCPELHDWSVEWSEGVSVSGTAREYDRATNVTAGTVAIAVNGTLQLGSTGTISGGMWTINNVTAFAGDVITVWVDGANEANEAVSVFVYDGVGDMTGVELFEQHLSVSADETATTTNALLSLYDNSVSGDEDIFFDVTATNDLEVCDGALTGCTNANLYIGSGNVFIPATSTSEIISTHDLVNDGTIELDGNTIRVSGTWENNATLSVDTSSVVFTATSTTETISDDSGTAAFYNVTFGETSGAATWQSENIYDVENNLSVNYGTLDRASSTITVSGDVSTGVSGYWSGNATTTFDGSGTSQWSDANSISQYIGYVVIDGSAKTVTLDTSVSALSVTVGADDTLNAGGSNTLFVSGDFINNNIFSAQTGTLSIVGSGVSAVVSTGVSSLYNFTASTTNGGSVSFNQANVTMLGDFVVATGTVTLPTATTSIGGSFSNSGGNFVHNNGEVRFTGAGSETIEANGGVFFNNFYDVSFTGSGVWTFTDVNATTTRDFVISNGSVTLPSGSLSVGGRYDTTGLGSFAHNNGEVVLLVQDGNTITTNGSSLNHVRVRSGSGSGAWYNDAWNNRLPITINATQISETLTDFPVYVDLADLPPGFFTEVLASGADIRVTQGDGTTELPVEVVSIDTGTDTGEMYFNANSISSSTDTTFYIYYGNSGASAYAATDIYGAENVWSNGFVMVAHLNDLTTSTLLNSANGSFNGVKASTNNPLEVATGKIYEAQDNSADDTDFGNIGAGASNITISGWFNADNLTGAGDTNTYGYTLFSASASGGYTWLTAGGTGNGGSVSEIRFCAFSASALCNVASGSNLTTGEWFYVSATAIDGGNSRVRVNGTEVLNFTSTGGGSWNSGSTLGDLRPGRNIEFDGRLDEFQISNVIRSAGWQDATYFNQSTTTDFYTTGAQESAFQRVFSDTNVTMLGDFTIESSEAVLPSGILSVGGSFDNNGIFDSNGGTVQFNSSAGVETVAAGNSSFATLAFDNSGGDFTITENATSTVAVQLTNANSFTLNSGITLEALGIFSNTVGGASTTWTGSTLKLSSGTDYSVNSKTDTGDVYDALLLTGDTDVSMWNSISTTYTLNDTASVYSQDHNGADGSLYIFGDYIRTSGTEYWNYATDFDGAALSATTSRQVNVRVANGSSVIASSSALSIIGTSTASTTIDAQSGSFALLARKATVTASYFEMTGTNINGLQLTASSTVTLLDNALFTIGSGVSAITVDASTVDTNPASQFFGTSFATGGGNVNVTLSGSPASYWWFRDGTGDRYGEIYDNADGDPGSIRWDDSSYTINISGSVYADDGNVTLGGPTCDGVTNTVRVVVDGGVYTDIVPCSGIDGSYTLSNVAYVGDPNIIVYLDTNGGVQGSVITKTPTASIVDLDIYANRVMTRHEDVASLTIADMATYDEDNDSDIRFIAATGTTDVLTVRPDSELYIFASSTFTPAGSVTLQSGGSGQTYDGSLHIGPDATFTGAGTTTYSIGGSFFMEPGAIFTSASSTVAMTATTSGKTVTASSTISFNEIQFTGVGGAWNINTDISVASDFYVATGTVTGTGDITVLNGSFYGDGTVSLGGGAVTVENTNTFGGVREWMFNDLVFGNGLTVGTTTPASVATTTVGGILTIRTAHFVDAGSSAWNLTGAGDVFVEDGTFLEDTSVVQYGGTGNANVLNTTYYNLSINSPSGSPTITSDAIGLQVLNDLRIGGASTTIFTLDANDPNVSVLGDVFIDSNGTLIGSDSSTLTVSGSWDNDGAFIHSGGLIDFNSADAFSVAPGSSSFNNVLISAVGVATVNENATSTGYWTLSSSSNFTVASGTRLAIGGLFTNTAAGTTTTWAGSTLHLFGVGSYEINASTTADTYNVLSVGAGTHIRTWNSDAVSYATASGGSVYSMNHSGVSGDLYIFGDYTQSSQTDYWSYETDFDGTVLAGISRRQANVFFESGSTATYIGGGLVALGSTTATTTLQNQGLGTYSLTFGGASNVDWSYGQIRDIDIDGVVFTGAPTVQDFSYTDMLVEQNSGTAVTVGGTAINASPAKNFTNNTFAVSGGVTGAVNVTATGTSVSSWRYTNTNGALAGEAFDSDPAGDPGYVVWDDSAALITVSGNVYSDEGSTVSGVCDGVTANIFLRVAGLTTASTTCDAGTGAYSISNVTFSANDTLTLYINNEAVVAANVSIDPISSISDMDLYENRVIVRHEGTDPITIADMSVWDSSDDIDIPFTALDAGTDTLTLPANTKLIVWNNKEFAPAGEVTLSGGGAGAVYDGTLELYNDAIFTAVGTQRHSIGGSLVLGSGATYVPANSTTTFTTSAPARTIDINDGSFNNIEFTGSGSWNVTDTVLNAHNILLTSGVLTLPSGTTTISGSFNNSGGAFTHNGSLMVFTGVGSNNIVAFDASDVAGLQFIGSGSWNMTDVNATTTASLTISNGTVTLPSGTLVVGGDFRNTGGSVTHNTSELIFSSASTTTLLASGSDLYSVTYRGGGNYSIEDSDIALLGSFTIASGTVTSATGTLSIGGSFDASGGVFNHATGSILFNSSDTGETVNTGESSFYNVVFGNSLGGWTITNSATTTNNFTLTGASSFTQQGGTSLYVGNVFTNSVGGSATDWSGSTLILGSASTYAINSKVSGGDDYQTIQINADTDISSWNSRATTTLVASSSSLYSQDHAGTDGALSIYGDYHISTSTNYWSYATDFDGTSLGGFSRAVTVSIADGATTTVDGGSLQIVGASGASTTIQNQGSGTYAFAVNAGTFNAQYYAYRDMNVDGLQFSGIPTITSLSNGDFRLSVDTGSLITLASTTLNANASKLITNVRFSTTTAITGVNVNLDATSTNAWTFKDHSGNLDGESYDIDGVSLCGSVRWDDSACLLVEQTQYRWRNDDGNLGVPDSEWFDVSWNKRKRVRIDNQDALTYATTSVKFTVAYDADMQSDFEDLRFTDSDGVTQIPYWVETYVASTDAVVWVQIPSLAASSIHDIFMYYDNVSATTTGSSTQVFIVADDFEDANISEYSGDTGLFTVDGSFAYGGNYGLDTTGFESSRATDGIGRTDQVVSQGEIIRYMQYVDTSAGASDEACTLFGVQSVTGNTNYGVCLEQFGVDRMTLARNVESTDTYGGVVVLATTTVSYSTGWYEVEIDWQTDDTIDVALYTAAGAFVASTTASDGTYTSGGYGFTYWGQNGGWDSFSSRNRVNTAPAVLFGSEQLSGGASWNNPLNSTSIGFKVGDTARLRVAVENSGLDITNQTFLLEYAEKGSSPVCEAVDSADYVAVPTQGSCTGSSLCMVTSSNLGDGDVTTDLLLDTKGTFTTGRAIEDPSNITGSLNINQNQYTELEYVLSSTIDASSDAYCLRVTNNGSDLDAYTSVAELAIQFDPVISTVSFNSGADISLTPGTTTRVYATSSVTDLNGYTNLQLSTSTMYTNVSGAACTPDDNDCYVATEASTCSFTNCSGNTCDLECYADVQYHANPTDLNGGDWYAFLEVEDQQGGYDFSTSPAIDLFTLNALDVTSSIGYGSLAVASTTASFNPTTTIQNLGNNAIDINLDGTDLTDGDSSFIPTNQQLFATSSFAYSSCVACTAMSTTTIPNYEVDLSKPTTTAAAVEDIIYWGIAIPFGVASNPHSGINTFYAVTD